MIFGSKENRLIRIAFVIIYILGERGGIKPAYYKQGNE
jgi:hypothetical protein